jgi:hypothetical protein
MANSALSREALGSDISCFDERSDMAAWAWILLVGGLVGMFGAALIVAAIWEATHQFFRRWDPLP